MAEIKVKNGADGLVNSTTDLSATHVKASNDIYSRDRETSPNKSADYNSPTTHKPLISSSDDLDLVRSNTINDTVRSTAPEIVIQTSYARPSEVKAVDTSTRVQPAAHSPTPYSRHSVEPSTHTDGSGRHYESQVPAPTSNRRNSVTPSDSQPSDSPSPYFYSRSRKSYRQRALSNQPEGLSGAAAVAHDTADDQAYLVQNSTDYLTQLVHSTDSNFNVTSAGSDRAFVHPAGAASRTGAHSGFTGPTTVKPKSQKFTVREHITATARDLVAGTDGSGENDPGIALTQDVRRSFVRGSAALYGANRYRIQQRKQTAKQLRASFSAAAEKRDAAATAAGIDITSPSYLAKKQQTKRAADKLIRSKSHLAGRKAMAKRLSTDVVRDVGNRIKNYESNSDNLGLDGVTELKDTAVNAFYAAKYARQTTVALARFAHRSVHLAQVAITHVKEALVKVGTFALQAAASSPIALVISAVILVLMVVSSLLPTFSLKTEDTTLTKLYKYCTELDAKFSEAVSTQLNRSGFDRIDFYQNGAKSNGLTIWSTETDLDTLIAYYDAMFEDYSEKEEIDESDIQEPDPDVSDPDQSDPSEDGDTESADGDSESNSENSQESDQDAVITKDNYKEVKKYSKNLWNQMYSLTVGSHTEKHTSSYTGSDGKTHHSTTTYHILDVYVTTKSLLEIANENARPTGDDGTAYSNVFDTPFGYLTKAQEDTYDVLQEVGLYTTLEEIDNPFTDPDSDTDTTWSVARRYGYYIDLPAGNYHPKENKGLYISAQTGDAVYAGLSGEATVDGDAVTIESSSRKITYKNLSSIKVSSGSQVTAGDQLGSVGDNSDLPSATLYVAYTRNGKELNPRFYIQGCLYGNSSGTGNGDIVQTALSQVGTLETPVNQVMYNDWFYGTHVSGSGYPWCAAFVSWCADQNGFIDAGIVPKVASCTAYRDFYSARGQFHRANTGYIPKSGDFVLFSSSGYPMGGAHIGIVISCDGSKVYTVEGNTSDGNGFNANGGGVWTKSHAFTPGTTTSGIWGYCSPTYPESSGSTTEPPAGAVKIGHYQITHYCPCAICNDRSDQLTALGTKLKPGTTIAVDPSLIPLGSKVWIEGYGIRTAEDTGGAIKGKHIDMCVSTHAEAMHKGVVYKDVYIIK